MSRGNARFHDHRWGSAPGLLFAAAIVAAFAVGPALNAEDGWTLRLEPMHTSVFGHNQHVLNVTTPVDGGQAVEAVTLDTDGAVSWRHELQYTRGSWTWGWDFLWHVTEQSTPEITSSSTGTSFQSPGRSFESTNPDDRLFFRTLADTDLALWTFDLYGMKSLASSGDDTYSVQFGVRFADFDNDYRATAGVEGQFGTRYDTSSNYGRMTGPLVGIAADFTRGRHVFHAYLGQSVVVGSADLTFQMRDYIGQFGEEPDPDPEFVSNKVIEWRNQDVAIPITEVRLKWTWRLTEHFGAGVGLNTSAWWDVPVPPGTVPGREMELNENNVILVGAFVALEVRF